MQQRSQILYFPSSNRGVGLVFGSFAIGTAALAAFPIIVITRITDALPFCGCDHLKS